MKKQSPLCLPVMLMLITAAFLFCSFSWIKDHSPRLSFKSEKLKLSSETIVRNKGELLSFELWFEQKIKKSETPQSTNLLWEIQFIDNSPFIRDDKFAEKFTSTTLYNPQKSNAKIKSGDLKLGEINESGEFEFTISVVDLEDDYVYGETTGILIVNELGESNNDLGGF